MKSVGNRYCASQSVPGTEINLDRKTEPGGGGMRDGEFDEENGADGRRDALEMEFDGEI